ncbi:MAG: PEP-CTERM sorting domain-containing protein [Planctomycetota bacterium]
MKRLTACLLILSLCAPAVLAEITEGFDYTISDTYEFGIFPLNNESLLITGAGAYQIDAKGGSYIEVQDTAPLEQNVGGIYGLNLDDSSTMDYYGGETNLFRIIDNARATFSGGSINYISSYQDSDLTKHITFIADLDSIGFDGSVLTGNWLDGSSFSVTLQDQAGYDSVYSNINFIPEPATLALFGLGGLLLRKKKYRR